MNFSGWGGSVRGGVEGEKSMAKPFNSLHFLMLSDSDPVWWRGEAS